jgi:hypothetical protein
MCPQDSRERIRENRVTSVLMMGCFCRRQLQQPRGGAATFQTSLRALFLRGDTLLSRSRCASRSSQGHGSAWQILSANLQSTRQRNQTAARVGRGVLAAELCGRHARCHAVERGETESAGSWTREPTHRNEDPEEKRLSRNRPGQRSGSGRRAGPVDGAGHCLVHAVVSQTQRHVTSSGAVVGNGTSPGARNVQGRGRTRRRRC